MDHKGLLTSSDDDVALEVISVGDNVLDGELAAFSVLDTVSGQLLLPLTLTVDVLVAVVLRRDDDTSLVVGKVRDDVTPGLVVVNAQSGDEVLLRLGVGYEAKGAASATTAHLEHIVPLDLVPSSTVGILPDSLFDGAEACTRVGVEDARGDCVTHSRGNSESLVGFGRRRRNTFDTTRE